MFAFSSEQIDLNTQKWEARDSNPKPSQGKALKGLVDEVNSGSFLAPRSILVCLPAAAPAALRCIWSWQTPCGPPAWTTCPGPLRTAEPGHRHTVCTMDVDDKCIKIKGPIYFQLF